MLPALKVLTEVTTQCGELNLRPLGLRELAGGAAWTGVGGRRRHPGGISEA